MKHLIAAAATVLLLGAGNANSQSYNLSTDFGSSVFKYGQGTAGTSFTAFAQVQGGSPGCASGFTCYLGNGGFPFIQKNNSSTAVTLNNGEISVPGGAIDTHPASGGAGTDAIILFTAQTAGTYDISGSFRRDNNTASGNGVVGSVFSQVTNGLPIFLFQMPLAPAGGNPTLNFSVLANLVVGQTIGFAINNAGDYTFDSTGLAATITNRTAAVPGPLAGAGLVPLLGLAGAWFARRRHEKLAA